MRADQGYTRAPPLRHPSSCLYARALSVHAHTRSSLGRIIHYRVHVMLRVTSTKTRRISSDNLKEFKLGGRECTKRKQIAWYFTIHRVLYNTLCVILQFF